MTNQTPKPTPPICESCGREVKAGNPGKLVWRKYEARWICEDCDVWATLLFGDDEEEE